MRAIGLITDGAVLMSNGVITAVGPSRRIENLADARYAHEISASGRVVMPAFVDSYAYPFRAPAVEGRNPHGSPEQQLRRMVRHCIAHGTGTLEAKIPLMEDEAAQLRLLRLINGLQEQISVLCSVVINRPMKGLTESAEIIRQKLVAILTRIRGRNLAQSVDVVCDSNHFRAAEAKAILEAAQRTGFRRKIYAGEASIEACITMAAASGVTSIEGLNLATESEAQALAGTNTIGTLLASDAYQSTAPMPPARMLVDSGVAVAIATGTNRSAPSTFSMQTAIFLAVHELRLTEEEAINAATMNAAHAVGEAQHAGSIEFGKTADLLLLDTSDYRDLTHYHGVNLTGMCIKGGEVVYRRQELSWP